MKEHNLIIGLLSFIISILIISCEINIPNKNFNFYERSSINADCLPLDSPYNIRMPPFNSKLYTILEGLTPIVGSLPVKEQYKLLPYYDSTTDILFSSFYIYELTRRDLYLYNHNLINLEQINFSEMLSANAKRFRAGLGCIEHVNYKFEIHSLKKDHDIWGNINSNNRDMLYASNQLNHCEKDFYQLLFTILNKRKDILTLITTASYYNPIQPIDYFIRNNNKIVGIRYTADDINSITNGFKKYAVCHQAFNNIIHRKTLENIISFTLFSQCLDIDNRNYDAGKSSDGSNNPSYDYKNGELIGINKDSGVRADNRTQNNYLLNHGYRFGTNNVQTDYLMKPIIPIPPEWMNKLYAAREFALNFNLYSNIISSINDLHNKRPFADLLSFIFEMADSTKTLPLKKIINNGCTGNYIIECYTFCTSYPKSNPDISESDLNTINISPNQENIILGHSQFSQYNRNFVLSSHIITLLCRNNKLSVFSDAYNSILGRVFDYYEDDQSFGSYNAGISQSCFGVFTSGGKNDKDACRDVLNKKCEIELDYRCKESGLYDYINQNPPAKRVLPKDCLFTYDSSDKPDNFKCFNFVAKHFILGTLSISPDAFISYSQSAQIEANDGIPKVSQYYYEPKSIDEIVVTSYPLLFAGEMTVNNYYFYVEDNKYDSFTSDSILSQEMKTTVNLQKNKAQYLSLNLFCFISVLYLIAI